ncbi:hypothetical protein BCR36DRAFT_328148 [Piromyces finnis]|uniref:Uncharacterized protein n=1 Tax=Piromyces finnis TaxID=1754191 RepID=A0A1Y1V8Q9_9FUNG|nr:hypothetical protein BCR36DRAFT_328148 [Piromyces finnis]|eukprot:ORX49750.1 hypothetical protein BCR36DRAFT_328148 [Piromyces finnis]
MKNSYKYSNLYNTKRDNFLPLLTSKSNKKEKYEPQDFYYPIKYEPKNNNYSSVGFRSKTNRFEDIKPTPHELDLEPYIPVNDKLVEHRVLNRPWLQQIQATLGDVFINDHTNDGMINSSKIINSLSCDNSNDKNELMILKSNQQEEKKIKKISFGVNSIINNESKLGYNDSLNQDTNEIRKTQNMNPYSECFFIKEPYKILIGNGKSINEEEEKINQYANFFEYQNSISSTDQTRSLHDDDEETSNDNQKSIMTSKYSNNSINNNEDNNNDTTNTNSISIKNSNNSLDKEKEMSFSVLNNESPENNIS